MPYNPFHTAVQARQWPKVAYLLLIGLSRAATPPQAAEARKRAKVPKPAA